MNINNSSVTLPDGYSFLGVNVGIKDRSLDLGVIHSRVIASATALFTTNAIVGAPIIVGRKHIQNGRIQAVVVNSKNANVYTGERGIEDCQFICQHLAKELKLTSSNLIFPSSTGVISQPLNMSAIKAGLTGIGVKLKPNLENLQNFSQAILTTDTHPKWEISKIGSATLVGIAKGAGMIEPDLATMLVYFITDAAFTPQELNRMLKIAVKNSFNCLTIDGDMSTSDTVFLMANGQRGRVDKSVFNRELKKMSWSLAQTILNDGEGITKVIELKINNSDNYFNTRKIAKSILNSFLVKTSWYGQELNWGRIIMAIGKTKVKSIQPQKIKIYLLDENKKIMLNPHSLVPKFDKNKKTLILIKSVLKRKKINLEINLGIGKYSHTFWGTDVSEKSVRLNSKYIT